jgi:hypothetical protein
MTIIAIRTFFVLLSTVAGYYIGSILGVYDPAWIIGGAIAGFCSSILVILVEMAMKRLSIRNLSAAVFGLIFGFFMA